MLLEDAVPEPPDRPARRSRPRPTSRRAEAAKRPADGIGAIDLPGPNAADVTDWFDGLLEAHQTKRRPLR